VGYRIIQQECGTKLVEKIINQYIILSWVVCVDIGIITVFFAWSHSAHLDTDVRKTRNLHFSDCTFIHVYNIYIVNPCFFSKLPNTRLNFRGDVFIRAVIVSVKSIYTYIIEMVCGNLCLSAVL
jgi:hypothetical protein